MPRHITPHNALIGTAEAVRHAPRRLLSAIPGHRHIEDSIEARRYADQQSRLQRLGGLAVVDGFSTGERSKDRVRGERVLSILLASQLIEQGRIVGIQPVIYATAQREHGRSLSRRAQTLSKRIDADKVGGETLFNPKPIVVDSKRGGATNALYTAINEAALDLEQKTQELTGQQADTYVPAPSLLLVMSAGHIAHALRGSTYDDVARSGIVTLDSMGRVPRDNTWIPGRIPLPTDRPLPAAYPQLVEPAAPAAVQPYTSVYF